MEVDEEMICAKYSLENIEGNSNSQKDDGPYVDPQAVISLQRGTPFTSDEASQVYKRYKRMDPSGKNGITVEECMAMPEFSGNKFAPDVITQHRDPETKRINARSFMKIAALFCHKTPAQTKKEALFDMFDVDKQKVLTHDAMFRIYKLFFGNAISDDHILALVFSALRHPNLAKDGEVSRDEFIEMVTDNEIHERFSVNFLFGQRKHRQLANTDTINEVDEDQGNEEEGEEDDDDDDEGEEEEEEEEEAPKNEGKPSNNKNF